jgi:hypothetical protein
LRAALGAVEGTTIVTVIVLLLGSQADMQVLADVTERD